MRLLIRTNIAILISLTIVTAWYVWPDAITKNFNVTIAEANRNFSAITKPIATFKKKEIKRFFASAEFINADSHLPSTFEYDKNELKQIIKPNCDQTLSYKNDTLSKVNTLNHSFCNHQKLSVDFFTQPPFFHPLGKSIAYRYFIHFQDDLTDEEITQLTPYMHITDILSHSKLTSLASDEFVYLLNLPLSELRRMDSEDNSFFSQRFLFKRREGLETVYDIYRKSDFARHLHAYNIAVSFSSRSHCPYKQGDICYEMQQRKVAWVVYSLFIAIIIGIISLLCLNRRSSNSLRRKLNKEKEIILANLSHELRTPITSMLLELENLGNTGDYTFIASMKKQLQRLNQIAETSHNIIRFAELKDASQQLTSVDEILDLFSDKAELEIHSQSSLSGIKVRGAVQYIKIVIENIINNAHKYGRPPVTVSTNRSANGRQFVITISDHGKIDPNITQNNKSAFFGKIKAHNTGLGLFLSDTIMRHFSGKLIIKSAPTRMILEFEVVQC